MSEHTRAGAQRPPDLVAAVLRTALRLRQRGDRARARALLRALAAQHPGDPRVWLALATVAETRDEQRMALDRVLALDPQHPLALRGRARFEAAVAAERPPTAPPPTSPTPADELVAIPPPIRWPAYAVAGVAIALVAAVALLVRALPSESPLRPTPPLPNAALLTTAPIAAPPTRVLPSPTPLPTHTPTSLPTPRPTRTPPSATPLPQPTLPPGQVLRQGQWHASLLRPEHAIVLDGGIGGLRPSGRFVLALATIGNDGQLPSRIPSDLFRLVDEQGNRYLPISGASGAYLNAFGRGIHGDMSMEELIPSGGGNVSVPLIFDVPHGARGLRLHMGSSPEGWAVRELVEATAPI